MTCSSFSLRRLSALIAAVIIFSGFSFADSISGTVTNKTNNKPAAGDDVVLIRLAQGMQEATRTKTDAKGNFTLQLPEPGMHLIRVTHDKANYFRPAPPGTQSVDIDVYDAAAKVAGVSSEADVMRIQTDESTKSLRVVENFFVKNDSNPPRTQFGDRPFEFYLPAGAVVEGSAALAPGGMPVQASPTPLGDANHYAFVFPIRPGETRFQITYKLPYSGKPEAWAEAYDGHGHDRHHDAKEHELPGWLGKPAIRRSLRRRRRRRMWHAMSRHRSRWSSPSPAQGSFRVTVPRQLMADRQARNRLPEAQPPRTPGRAEGLGTPIDPEGTNDPWAKYKWWILGGLGLAMAAGAGVMLKNGPQSTTAATNLQPVAASMSTASGDLLSTLKEELFALETDRLEGRLGEAEYAEQKAALEVVLKRALLRKEPGPVASKPTEVNPLRG